MSDAFERRQIVLGVTGSIAAYKAAELSRLLVSRGYEIRTVMTESAREFISPLTLQSVTGHSVVTDFWETSELSGIGHIEIADWAHALVIAPATADVIAKLAMGFSDTPLLAIALATKAPILVAPAMNVNMFEHPKTQENIKLLKDRGVSFVEPEEGVLACGWNGTGRLASPEEVFYHVRRVLSRQDLLGKKVLITTGPTREPIDPVRFISNRSSGKMGVALAREAFCRGADVTLVHGPATINVPGPVKCHAVVTADEMREVVKNALSSKVNKPDIVIMAAAVADYRPSEVAEYKIKKSTKPSVIKLTTNPDILAQIGKEKGKSELPLLVGFAVETGEVDELIDSVRSKLKDKNADMMIGNLANDAFDQDTNRVWIIDRHGRQEEIATTYKSRVANKILDAIVKL